MIFSIELPGYVEAGQRLAKSLDNASPVEGKKKDPWSESAHFPERD